MNDFKKKLTQSLKTAISTVDTSKLLLPGIAFVAGFLLTFLSVRQVIVFWGEQYAMFAPLFYIGGILTAIFSVLVRKK